MGRARRQAILAAAMGGLTLVGNTSAAITASWIAPIDSSWTDPSAWSTNPSYPNNGQPNPADLYNAIIAATGSAYTVSLNSDIDINTLSLNSASATLAQTGGTFRLDNGGTISAGRYILN